VDLQKAPCPQKVGALASLIYLRRTEGFLNRKQNRWVARIKPLAAVSVDALLHMPLSLDVWEREADSLLVAADDGQLTELERRKLAEVHRLYTVSDYLRNVQRGRQPEQEARKDRTRP
jgi:hypothetical protein